MKYLIILFSIIFISCATKKETNIKHFENRLENGLKIDEIYGTVISIDSTKRNYSIMVEDTIIKRKHLILSMIQDNNFSNNKVKLKHNYLFKVVKLSHQKISNDTLEINGQKIVKRPNLAISDCIIFNNESFCTGNYEIYEEINLSGLNIYKTAD